MQYQIDSHLAGRTNQGPDGRLAMHPVSTSTFFEFLENHGLKGKGPDIVIEKWTQNGVVLAERFNDKPRIDPEAVKALEGMKCSK